MAFIGFFMRSQRAVSEGGRDTRGIWRGTQLRNPAGMAIEFWETYVKFTPVGAEPFA